MMTRKMQSEDLGDLHLYEDEAIREQAARLYIHATNLREKVDKAEYISRKTMQRIHNLFRVIDFANDEAKEKWQG